MAPIEAAADAVRHPNEVLYTQSHLPASLAPLGIVQHSIDLKYCHHSDHNVRFQYTLDAGEDLIKLLCDTSWVLDTEVSLRDDFGYYRLTHAEFLDILFTVAKEN